MVSLLLWPSRTNTHIHSLCMCAVKWSVWTVKILCFICIRKNRQRQLCTTYVTQALCVIAMCKLRLQDSWCRCQSRIFFSVWHTSTDQSNLSATHPNSIIKPFVLPPLSMKSYEAGMLKKKKRKEDPAHVVHSISTRTLRNQNTSEDSQLYIYNFRSVIFIFKGKLQSATQT